MRKGVTTMITTIIFISLTVVFSLFIYSYMKNKQKEISKQEKNMAYVDLEVIFNKVYIPQGFEPYFNSFTNKKSIEELKEKDFLRHQWIIIDNDELSDIGIMNLKKYKKNLLYLENYYNSNIYFLDKFGVQDLVVTSLKKIYYNNKKKNVNILTYLPITYEDLYPVVVSEPQKIVDHLNKILDVPSSQSVFYTYLVLDSKIYFVIFDPYNKLIKLINLKDNSVREISYSSNSEIQLDPETKFLIIDDNPPNVEIMRKKITTKLFKNFGAVVGGSIYYGPNSKLFFLKRDDKLMLITTNRVYPIDNSLNTALFTIKREGNSDTVHIYYTNPYVCWKKDKAIFCPIGILKYFPEIIDDFLSTN